MPFGRLHKWIELMVISAISIFDMKMYKLFFFGTQETLDLNNIVRATFDVNIKSV